MDLEAASDLLASIAGKGDPKALDALFDLVHAELRRVAHIQLAGERSDHTLTPTALVNEAYLKLVAHTPGRLADRKHFLAVAGRAMRQVLVNYAASRRTEKRGGGLERVTLNDQVDATDGTVASLEEILAVDQALAELELIDDRLARIVEYRFFAGMDQKEVASLLGISVPTVKRDWRLARAWLRGALDRRSGV